MIKIWNQNDHIEIITDKKSLENIDEKDEIVLPISNELITIMLIKKARGEHLLYDSEKGLQNYNTDR